MEKKESATDERAVILDLVSEFADHALRPEHPFRPGVDPVPVSGKVLAPSDFVALVDSALDGWLTAGRFHKAFERELARFVGVRNALFVNSGSSANLAALSALTSEKLGKRALQPGDEVITVAAGFPTTVNPIIQNGLTPVLVDADIGTYNAITEQIAEAIGPKTKAIMMAHALGNPFDLHRISELREKYGLWLIEDSCDALGASFDGKRVGSFGDLATVSFYPAHHITTGEGGAVLVNSPLLRKQVESFRDWGRDCYCETGVDNTCKKRFEWKLGGLPEGYDHKYIYSHIGYNLKGTDLQASLGLSQLQRLPDFVKRRRENFSLLLEGLSRVEGLIMPRSAPEAEPSWFGFPITLENGVGFDRKSLLKHLDTLLIGTRLFFGGNIVRQPAYRKTNFRVIGDLRNANTITEKTFWLGVFPGLTREMLEYVVASISDFVAKRG